jgi:hypothetical protein
LCRGHWQGGICSRMGVCWQREACWDGMVSSEGSDRAWRGRDMVGSILDGQAPFQTARLDTHTGECLTAVTPSLLTVHHMAALLALHGRVGHACGPPRAEVRRVLRVGHASKAARIDDSDERACRLDETALWPRNRRAAQCPMGVLRCAAETPSATRTWYQPRSVSHHHLASAAVIRTTPSGICSCSPGVLGPPDLCTRQSVA